MSWQFRTLAGSPLNVTASSVKGELKSSECTLWCLVYWAMEWHGLTVISIVNTPTMMIMNELLLPMMIMMVMGNHDDMVLMSN